MLKLTRRINETIIIGDDDIRITVLSVKGNQVKIGVNAPTSLSVHREEIFLKIREEERGAHDSTDNANTNKGFLNELATLVKPVIRYKISRRKPDSDKAA